MYYKIILYIPTDLVFCRYSENVDEPSPTLCSTTLNPKYP